MQFSRETRIELAILLTTRKSQTDCAKILGIARSNVCLEINRNKDEDGVYRGLHAHRRYLARRKEAKTKERKIENDTKLRNYIITHLKKYWSPEQIAGRLKREKKSDIVHETIYRWIYEKRKDLTVYLRHEKSKYRRKRGSLARKTQNKALKMRRIEERPSVVNDRSRIGDWEGDTVIGKERKQRILTYVERKSGFAMADVLHEVTAEIVEKKTEKLFLSLPRNKRLTLTRDNGLEFGDLDRTLEERTKMEVYRATAYSSWERGTNENWNGLLRQFFPKGMLFATVTSYHIKEAVRLLNDRPRKRLGYAKPREEFKGCYDSD
jgi:IS30 family transposase